MRSHRTILALLLVVAAPAASLSAEEKWTDVLKLADPADDAVAGNWERTREGLSVSAAPSARIVIPHRPSGEYDLRASFTRRSGTHSIAIFFVTPQGQATFELDCWGEHVGGVQLINDEDNRANATRIEDLALVNGRRYSVTIEVRKDRIRFLLDNKEMCSVPVTKELTLTPLELWQLPDRKALGLGAYSSETVFHSLEVRPTGPGAVAVKPVPMDKPMPKEEPMPAPGEVRPGARRVLLVIANQDFFYREYDEPRRALEAAQIQVDVAAATRTRCRPHANSGEGTDGGVVMPDIALADVNPERYDAIVFAGGWGASGYQFDFKGTYRNKAYQGTQASKSLANDLIGKFLDRKKYVVGICHGVSVLAWARVNDVSPLKDKQVVAPTLSSPAGAFPDYQGTPPSRWNSTVNGARVLPANSVGNPGTSVDDVMVDGLIITGQDDGSARAVGQRLAELLKEME